MKDICKYITEKSDERSIECYHFVYETGIKKFPMPIVRNNYYINLVFKGKGTLAVDEEIYELSMGTMFFSFPGIPFSIECDNDFSFLYISFNGEGAEGLLKGFGIGRETCVFYNLDNLSDFWMREIRRINSANSQVITESILMYSLSYTLNPCEEQKEDTKRCESVINYIHSCAGKPALHAAAPADQRRFLQRVADHAHLAHRQSCME